MRQIAWLLVFGLLAGCGDEEPPRVRLPEGAVSAFSFARAPAGLKHAIPLAEIANGIGSADPKDRIPALWQPEHVSVASARHLVDADRVLVYPARDALETNRRAYPLFLLDGHELVNDVVEGRPILVSWCPLCGSGMVFDRQVAGRVRTFGVSGYLWRSDVLMYDRESESFWSQIAGRAVVGPLSGAPLSALPSYVTTWGDFRSQHPNGRVLLTGRTEGNDPAVYRAKPYYAAYRANEELWRGVVLSDHRLRAKEEVIGVERSGKPHAWSLAHLRASPGEIREQIGGDWLFVRYDRASDRVEVLDAEGSPVVSLRAYWFAWTLFHPETGLTGGAADR